MDPKVTVSVRPETQSYVAQIEFDAQFLESVRRRLPDYLVDLAANAIAEQFIRDKGAELLATIDVKSVVNLAVAKVVVRLSEETSK